MHADTYPALLWNGARLHRAGARRVEALTLVAIASAPDPTPDPSLERGVHAGLRIGTEVDDGVLDGVGRPTTDLLPAAACAAVVCGADPADLTSLLDLAGTLMVVGPPSILRADEDGGLGTDPVTDAEMRAGHCLAAGWLAPRLLDAGLIAQDGALDSTIAAVTGRAPAGLMARLR